LTGPPLLSEIGWPRCGATTGVTPRKYSSRSSKMRTRTPHDRHVKRACISEIRKANAARLVFSAENHVPLRPIEGATGIDATFKRATDIGLQARVATARFFRHVDQPYIRRYALPI
jgi:hypothetical protein